MVTPEVGAYVTFIIAFVILLVFSSALIKYFEDRFDRENIVTTTSIIGLLTSLTLLLLIPIDIYLTASTTDNSTGIKYPWATPERVGRIMLGVRAGYYGFYTTVAVWCFIVLPWVYFYFEEGGGDEGVKQRALTATKYTIFAIIIATAFLLTGLVLQTNLDNEKYKDVEWFKKLFLNTDSTLPILLGTLTLLGLPIYTTYTSLGLSFLPVRMIQSGSSEMRGREARSQLEVVREELRALRSRRERVGGEFGAAEIRVLEEKERDLERILDNLPRLSPIPFVRVITTVGVRPVQILLGTIFLLLSTTTIFSLLLALIDKLKNSFCGSKCGWMLNHPQFYNPINHIFTHYPKVTPILYPILIFYLLLATLTTLTTVGLRFLCLKLYPIRTRATPPQGILGMTLLLMLASVTWGYMMMVLAPGWSTFGGQKYCSIPGPTPNCTLTPHKIRPCTLNAPTTLCTPSTLSQLYNKTTYMMPLLGSIFYWAQWVVVGMFVVGLVSVIAIGAAKQEESETESESEAEENGGLRRDERRRLLDGASENV